ncbi:MAG: Trp family transcriptional regulator [Patescibacteria group bacterium]
MTQISRIPLRKEVEQRVYEVLMESIAAARTRDTVVRLVDDLLSPTERLMIAKRLSIALLLLKHYDQRTISSWLKVSLGTVSKVSLALQRGRGGYQTVIATILGKEELQSLIRKIDDALANLFGPPPGRDWRSWRRRRWEAKMAAQKAF